jgi:DHA1 family bicyclomycin/chloramphenicol resistance-like MFS transporter
MTADSAAAMPKVGRPMILLLGLMAAMAPLAVTIHVQSIPTIAAGLDASYAATQLTVSLFLFVFAVVQLVVGPLSDRLGRRPVLFGGLAVFSLGGLAAAAAPTIEIMIAARILQAAGGCVSLVIPRAVVRDRESGVEAARILTLVSMVQSASPIVAPIVGGAIDIVFGWRAIFVFLAAYAAALGIAAWLRLPESRPTEGGAVAGWATILSRYGRLLATRRFLAYAAVFALGCTGYMGFLSSGPAVMIDDMGLAPWQFSLVLGAVSIQFVAGGYLASRLVVRHGIDRLLFAGAVVQVIAVLAFFFAAASSNAVVVTATFCLYTFSNGLIFANSLAGATAVDPRIAGSAASILGALQFTVGGLVAVTVASFPTTDFGVFPWVLVVLALGTLAGVLVARTAPAENRQDLHG